MNKQITTVRLFIRYKERLHDPEGPTIYNDMVKHSGYSNVKSCKVMKTIDFEIEHDANDDYDNAQINIDEMCNKLHVYNPILHEPEYQIISTRGLDKTANRQCEVDRQC